MSRVAPIRAPLPLAILALACATAPPDLAQPEAAPEEPSEEAEVELVGSLTRAEIEAAMPDWVGAQIEATPDVEQALRMAGAGPPDSRVTVYLGTWCSDSRRELARFWRAVDEAGGEVGFEIDYVGIRRDKDRRDPALATVELQRVPTFVVELAGVEAGRVVEESPNGIERDLAALLGGETTGLVTATEELLNP